MRGCRIKWVQADGAGDLVAATVNRREIRRHPTRSTDARNLVASSAGRGWEWWDAQGWRAAQGSGDASELSGHRRALCACGSGEVLGGWPG